MLSPFSRKKKESKTSKLKTLGDDNDGLTMRPLQFSTHASLQSLNLVLVACYLQKVLADPITKPYIARLTDPFDQTFPQHVTTQIDWEEQTSWSNAKPPTKPFVLKIDIDKLESCPSPVRFNFRSFPVTHSSPNEEGNSINSPPTIFPIHPSDGPAKSLLFLRQELLEMMDLNPPLHRVSTNDGAPVLHDTYRSQEDAEFPLLFQGSTFIGASPVIHDVNGDGIEDAILVDYNGLISMVGLGLITWIVGKILQGF